MMIKNVIIILLLTFTQLALSQKSPSASQSEKNTLSNFECEEETFAPITISPAPKHETREEKARYHERSISKASTQRRTTLRRKQFRRYISDDNISAILLATGVILALFAIFLPILFLWIGGWAFLVASCAMALGLVLIVLAGNFSNSLRRFGIALSFWGLLFLDIIALSLWAIVGSSIWW